MLHCFRHGLVNVQFGDVHVHFAVPFLRSRSCAPGLGESERALYTVGGRCRPSDPTKRDVLRERLAGHCPPIPAAAHSLECACTNARPPIPASWPSTARARTANPATLRRRILAEFETKLPRSNSSSGPPERERLERNYDDLLRRANAALTSSTAKQCHRYHYADPAPHGLGRRHPPRPRTPHPWSVGRELAPNPSAYPRSVPRCLRLRSADPPGSAASVLLHWTEDHLRSCPRPGSRSRQRRDRGQDRPGHVLQLGRGARPVHTCHHRAAINRSCPGTARLVSPPV